MSVVVHMLTGVVVVRLGDSWRADRPRDGSTLVLAQAPASLLRDPAMVEQPREPEPAVTPPPESTPPPPPPPPVLEVTPGVDGSTANVQTWKGFAEATEHMAPKFVVDQAGLTPKPGTATSENAPVDAAEHAQPEVAKVTLQALEPVATEPLPTEPTEAPRPESLSEPLPQPEPAADPQPEPKPEVTSSPMGILPAPEEWPVPRAVTEPAPEEARLPTPEPVGPPAPEALLQEPTRNPPQQQTALPTGEEGIRANDESVARSTEDAIIVRPGKPIARPGLNIKTATARFSPSTIALNRPKSPLVRITFGRDGRVLLAEFVPGHTTGSADVDKPLLDSLHRWSARGKDLLRIPENDPKAGVTLTFRIVF